VVIPLLEKSADVLDRQACNCVLFKKGEKCIRCEVLGPLRQALEILR